MYIQPQTNIRLLKNVPFDNTYEHTIYFSSPSSQSSYFSSLQKYNLTNYTYQRVRRGVARVGIVADSIYDCNYMMFQNSAYGTKWFYAFITSVEYVNNTCSEITFELDVMQTWLFDVTLKECFVEREHSETDEIGENLVPESLELGEYITASYDSFTALTETSIVVASTFNEEYQDIDASYYGGLFSGLYYNVFDNTLDGAVACAEFISGAGAKSDGIVSVFLMPTAFVIGRTGSLKTVSKQFAMNKQNMLRLDGENVHNKKLLTYPYNFLYVTNFQGNSAVYPYEYFTDTSNIVFYATGDMSPSPSVVVTPSNYKGVLGANYDEKIVITGYPQLSFNIDTFKSWLGANLFVLPITALSTGMNATNANYAVQNASSAEAYQVAVQRQGLLPLSRGLDVLNTLAPILQHSIMPNQARGGAGSQTLSAIGLLNVGFYNKRITKEFTTIIDNYFDMYGYATHRVKVPNRNSRPRWNYVKTKGVILDGSIPTDDMSLLHQIYDRGITFWKNGDNIGNYSLSNEPA